MKFDEKVLDLTKKIPRGKVTTYKEIARKLGTKAYRAVGNALNKNKDAPKVPCHRVIKSDGDIGGYSKGVNKKIRLLKKEGITITGDKIDKRYLFKF